MQKSKGERKMARIDTGVRRNLIKYISLNVLALLGTSCYVVVDTFFVANGIGTDAVAALNIVIVYFSLMIAIGNLIGMGTATRYAILMAKGETADASHVYTLGVITALICGGIMSLLGIFASVPLGRLMGADDQIIDMTATYLRIIWGFAPLYLMNYLYGAVVRNDNGPRLSMAAQLISNLANCVLDYIFIIMWGKGMAGAAFATAIAPVISLAIMSSHIWRGQAGFRFVNPAQGFSPGKWFGFIKLGNSAFFTELSTGFVVMVYNFLFLEFCGNDGVSAYGIVTNLNVLAFAIYIGVQQGIQPLVSEYYGKGQHENMVYSLKFALKIVLVVGVVLFGAVMIWANPIVGLYNSDGSQNIAELASFGLKVFYFGYIVGGVNMILAGYMSARDQAGRSFVISIMRGMVVISASAYLLSRVLGVNGIWYGMPVAEVITLIAGIYLLRKKEGVH